MPFAIIRLAVEGNQPAGTDRRHDRARAAHLRHAGAVRPQRLRDLPARDVARSGLGHQQGPRSAACARRASSPAPASPAIRATGRRPRRWWRGRASGCAATRRRRRSRASSSRIRACAACTRWRQSAARGAISVLILGETGVGKDVMAHEIHRLSPRAKAPFVALNCAALSESLLESELFGHEKGAFTGADRGEGRAARDGAGRHRVPRRDRRACRAKLQAKLLRVLETRELQRVGSVKTRADRRALHRRHQPRSRGGDRARGGSATTSTTG